MCLASIVSCCRRLKILLELARLAVDGGKLAARVLRARVGVRGGAHVEEVNVEQLHVRQGLVLEALVVHVELAQLIQVDFDELKQPRNQSPSIVILSSFFSLTLIKEVAFEHQHRVEQADEA